MNNWILEYNNWNVEQHPLIEALCTLGNGYFATRGALELTEANEYNYPGTYLAGGYNRAVSVIKDKDIENEDLVNWPDWLPLSLKIEKSGWLDIQKTEILDYVVRLHLKEGILERKIRFRDAEDRETSILSRRLVSMHDPNIAGIEWTIIPENWSGEVTVRSGLDGDVSNNGVKRYGDLNGNHIDILDKGIINEKNIYLTCATKQSKVLMVQAASTTLFQNEKKMDTQTTTNQDEKSVWQDIKITCSKLQPVRVEKLVSIYTSKDFAISDPITEASNKVAQTKSFLRVLDEHKKAWSLIWKHSNFDVKTGNGDIFALRLHIFHLYQTISKHSVGYDIGVPSRGWHGEAYRGHVFWDELFIFPFINLHNPHLARSLLMYRYRRLPKARAEAVENGYRGAMYPWQSGSNGREESQTIHLNPKSGRWIPDNSRLQRHINAAIPYNVWLYYQTTGDMDFLAGYGAEIILSTALFWSTIAQHNPKRDRFEIRGVMGPDEYHTSYPNSTSPGLNNNAYTNFMAVWVIQCALNILEMFDDDLVDEFFDKIGITETDIATWQKLTKQMYIPFNSEGIIMQFEGFDELKELDWQKYRKKHGEVMRLDRILEHENDSPNNYRANKQADVIMLFYLFSSHKLIDIFNQLGYDFTAEQIPENIAYYQKITSHGSSLSKVVYSWVFARSDRKRSWHNFKNALISDIQDVQGGTTPEGIHLGAMAGTVDIIQRCYTGLEMRKEMLWLNPRLPDEVQEINLQIRYRSHWIKLHINHKKLKVEFDQGWLKEPIEINVNGNSKVFEKNDTAEFELK
jgi:trehalose/maltose hydrolase-like predicted phosphorylase